MEKNHRRYCSESIVKQCAQGQKDPLVDYKNEAYELFVTLMNSIRQEALHHLFRATI